MSQPDIPSQALTLIPDPEQSLSLRIDEQIHQEAREYLRAGLQGSANSYRAFRTDLKQYSAWCQENGYEPTPLSAVALMEYVTSWDERVPSLPFNATWPVWPSSTASIESTHQLPTSSSRYL